MLDPTIIGDVADNGVWGGIKDYIGNSTNLGQGINAAGNLWQKLNGQSQSQLIGTPQAQINQANQIPPPVHDDSHFGKPDENGIRWMNDSGKQAANDHAQQFTIPQPMPFDPTSGDQANEQANGQPVQHGGGAKLLNGLQSAGMFGGQGAGIGGLLGAL